MLSLVVEAGVVGGSPTRSNVASSFVDCGIPSPSAEDAAYIHASTIAKGHAIRNGAEAGYP